MKRPGWNTFAHDAEKKRPGKNFYRIVQKKNHSVVNLNGSAANHKCSVVIMTHLVVKMNRSAANQKRSAAKMNPIMVKHNFPVQNQHRIEDPAERFTFTTEHFVFAFT